MPSGPTVSDFAGGTVVHLTPLAIAIIALAAVIVVTLLVLRYVQSRKNSN